MHPLYIPGIFCIQITAFSKIFSSLLDTIHHRDQKFKCEIYFTKYNF